MGYSALKGSDICLPQIHLFHKIHSFRHLVNHHVIHHSHLQMGKLRLGEKSWCGLG